MYSIFTWNQGSSSILFRHSRANLPEFSILSNFDPLACLVNHHQSKESTMSLSKADELALFEAAPQSELQHLLNHPTLTALEREHLYYHHRLKCISKDNMRRLIQLGLLPQKIS